MYQEAIEAKQRLALAYRHRGHAYIGKGEWGKAIADLTQAITLDPSAANAFGNRGYALTRIGITPAQSRIVRRPSASSQTLPAGTLIVLAHASALRDWNSGITDYTRAIDLGTDLPSYRSVNHCRRGYAFWQTGEFERGMADFAESIRLDPKNGEAFYYRALGYQHIGEKGKADYDFAQAKNLGYEDKT